jgi:L-2-hydroxyglutarate oxidase
VVAEQSDVLIVGGGIVGLATAYNLGLQYPDLCVTVLEKEARLAQHQTGHNSGVLHSGIYYKPGSLKASNCLAGRAAMLELCDREGIPYKICGKVIVALDEGDVARLDMLYERGTANGVRVEPIERGRLRELEPHAAGLKALYLPNAGVVDFRVVCERLAQRIAEAGGQVRTGAQVTGIREGAGEVIVRSNAGDFAARYVVNCAGLHSDRVATMATGRTSARIIPFRGEYYRLKSSAEHLCNNLIYPVPDPRFPFLGVHFTRTAWGEVECGPNAVLAFAREGYRKTDINLRDLSETLSYPGTLRMGAHYWKMGIGEMWRSLSKAAFVRALQRLMPDIGADDLEPMSAGVRAQAVGPDGALLDDFAFQESARTVHVINAPSPAATASISIGKSIVERLARKF